MGTRTKSKSLHNKLESILSSFKGASDELIAILQCAQEEFGYLSDETLTGIAKFAKVPLSKVYAVVTFYAQFRLTPIGKKHVVVCRGTACYVRGATRIREEIEKHLDIEEGQVTDDLEYSLETVACIGACALSPCIMINKKVEAKVTPKKIAELLKKKAKQ